MIRVCNTKLIKTAGGLDDSPAGKKIPLEEIIVMPLRTLSAFLALALLAAAGPAKADDGWQLRIDVTAGSSARTFVVAGVQQDASDGRDPAWDIEALLESLENSYLYASFPRPDWPEGAGNYAWEMQAPRAVNTWPLEVVSNISATLALAWDFSTLAEAGYSASLIDHNAGITIDLAAQPGYEFANTPGAPRSFELQVTAPVVAPPVVEPPPTSEPPPDAEPPPPVTEPPQTAEPPPPTTDPPPALASIALSWETRKDTVILSWQGTFQETVLRYDIYRLKEDSSFERVGQTPGTKNTYTDRTVKKSMRREAPRSFTYRVVAVAADGSELGASSSMEVPLP